MANIIKGLIGAQDLHRWCGTIADRLFNRPNASGGTDILNAVGYDVDALIAFGNGDQYNDATLATAKAVIGSTNKVRLTLRPGVWTIDNDLDMGTNIILYCPPGVKLTPASGKTLTCYIEAGPYQIIYGSGTVTVGNYPQDQQWWGNAQRLDIVGLTASGNASVGGNVAVTGTLKVGGVDVMVPTIFDANTILAANSNDTPAALTVAEDRILGRISGGNIAALTAAQVSTILGGSTIAKLATSRELVTATGTVSYTSVGFQPQALIILAHVNGTAFESLTFTTAAGSIGTYHYNSVVTLNIAAVTIQTADGYQTGTIKTMDADGFTLDWTRSGTPTGTITIHVLAFR